MKTLLKNGMIVDGTGQPAFLGCVILENDRIAGVVRGSAPLSFDGQIIDCSGKVIAPGFIDAHSHNDWFATMPDPVPYFKPFLEQGITTQISGNCGFSPFGYEKNTPYHSLLGSGLFKATPSSEDFSDFSSWCDKASLTSPVNLAPLLGHGSVRIGLSGYANRPLSSEETEKHRNKIQETLDQGAFGLSFGLQYEPDRYAPLEELEAAAELVAEKNGTLTVHSRSTSVASPFYYPPVGKEPHNLRALKEMIALAEKTGVRLQYSHLLFVGKSTWKTVDESLDLIHEAQARGVKILYDFFPMTFGTSVITVILPNWFLSLSKEEQAAKKNRLRLSIETQVSKLAVGFNFNDIQIAWAGSDDDSVTGKRISELASQWRCKELDAYLKVVEMSKAAGRVNMYRYYNDGIILKLMQDESSLFMTDAWIEKHGTQNAAAYGAFPRFLELTRESHVISLEKAIQKMTGSTADYFSIPERGYIRDGYFADITVFDPEHIKANPDLPEPPEGIVHVFVNGTQLVEQGKAKENLMCGCGRILRKV